MPEVKHYKVTEPYLDLQCGLGEAPFWDEKTNTLRLVDIVKKQLHVVELDKGPESLRTHQLDISVGTTANIEGNDDEFIFGGKAGYGIMNKRTAEWRYIKEMWTKEEVDSGYAGRMRSNDGAVDSQGRYWVGAMNDPSVTEIGPEGVLFRLDPDLSLHRIKESVKIPNGTSWTLDNKVMYFTESTSGEITKYPYDPSTGAMDQSKGEAFFKCPIKGGVPDGHCQDIEGCFWVALYGTSKVVRINPEGEIIAEIEVPTRCPTCPGIAGEDLYITSAKEEKPDQYPESVKYGGGLFKVHIGVKGCPLNKFKMQT